VAGSRGEVVTLLPAASHADEFTGWTREEKKKPRRPRV
jgi:hypothetical protein